jgi:hypothetical protein
MAFPPDFNTTITESKPTLRKAIQFVADLETGKITSAYPSVSFSGKTNTVNSHTYFDSAKIDEGSLNLFYFELDNDNSFVFLFGTLINLRVMSGGNFMHGAYTQNFNTASLSAYLNKRIKTWVSLYKSKDTTGLIDSVNKMMSDI